MSPIEIYEFIRIDWHATSSRYGKLKVPKAAAKEKLIIRAVWKSYISVFSYILFVLIYMQGEWDS